jgi:hypothetical protein
MPAPPTVTVVTCGNSEKREAMIEHDKTCYFLGDHAKAAIDDRVKSGHREKA